MLAWATAVFALALRTLKRTPVLVVRVTAEGTNQVSWLLIASFLPLALAALVSRDLLLIPLVVLTV